MMAGGFADRGRVAKAYRDPWFWAQICSSSLLILWAQMGPSLGDKKSSHGFAKDMMEVLML